MTHVPLDLGPLEPLLADPAVTAIYIDEDSIRVEKAGTAQTSGLRFDSDTQRRQVIESIVAACGAQLAAASPEVEGVLTDGTRVHATFTPLRLALHTPEGAARV